MEVLCGNSRRNQGPEPVVDERKIASGIFYLFEYLPHASQYVDLIIKLNNKIDNTIVQLSGMNCMNYLMRKPLLRIVNCYASGSVELFLTNLKDYAKIFLYVLVNYFIINRLYWKESGLFTRYQRKTDERNTEFP